MANNHQVANEDLILGLLLGSVGVHLDLREVLTLDSRCTGVDDCHRDFIRGAVKVSDGVTAVR
jgi:hypothetical protein